MHVYRVIEPVMFLHTRYVDFFLYCSPRFSMGLGVLTFSAETIAYFLQLISLEPVTISHSLREAALVDPGDLFGRLLINTSVSGQIGQFCELQQPN